MKYVLGICLVLLVATGVSAFPAEIFVREEMAHRVVATWIDGMRRNSPETIEPLLADQMLVYLLQDGREPSASSLSKGEFMWVLTSAFGPNRYVSYNPESLTYTYFENGSIMINGTLTTANVNIATNRVYGNYIRHASMYLMWNGDRYVVKMVTDMF
jgi:hypothetical protein